MKNKNSVRGLVILGIVLATWLVHRAGRTLCEKRGLLAELCVYPHRISRTAPYFQNFLPQRRKCPQQVLRLPHRPPRVVYLAVQLVLGLLVMALGQVGTHMGWRDSLCRHAGGCGGGLHCRRYDARRGGAAGRAAEKGCLCHARHAVQGQRAGKPVRCTGAASRTAKAGGGLPIQRSCQQRCAGGCGDVSICLFGRIAAQSHRWRFGQCSRPLPPRRRHPDGTKPTVQAE